MVPSNLSIQRASAEHVPEIVAIAQHFTVEGVPSSDAAERGFLVSGFTEDDYHELLVKSEHAYVALAGGEVAGFVIAHSSEHINEREWVNSTIKARHPDPFVIVKQIAVKDGYRGRGIASALYDQLTQAVRDRPFFAAVVLDPPNHRSIALHAKHGFRQEFDVLPPDGLPRGIFRRGASE